MKKEVSGLGMTIGQVCKYTKAAAAAGNTAAPPTAAARAPMTSKSHVSLPGQPQKLAWDVTPQTLAEWFEAWAIWYRAACPTQDQEKQLINLIRMHLDETWS